MPEEQYTLENSRTVTTVLRLFPLKIKEMEEQISAVSIVKEELIAKKKTIEADVALQISMEKEEVQVEQKADKRSMTKEEKENYKPTFVTEYKKKYPNEMQRESELRHRLANNKDFNEYQKQIDKHSKDINAKMIQFGYMKRLNSNAGYLAILGG